MARTKPHADESGKDKPHVMSKTELESLKAQIRDFMRRQCEEITKETGCFAGWASQQDVEHMIKTPGRMARDALRQVEQALASPAIWFVCKEALERCDATINAGSERLLTRGERRRLLEGREELANRLDELKKPDEEHRILGIAEELFDIAKTERWVKEEADSSSFTPEEADVVAAFLKKRKILYRQFHTLLDKVGERGFCRCIEAVWDYWVHGGPAEFLQDVKAYHRAGIQSALEAEARRQQAPDMWPNLEQDVKIIRHYYPRESALSNGLMNKSYGFVVTLPLLPRHIAKYVTSRHMKKWYVPGMQWWLSYGATVSPATIRWKRAFEASYNPFICSLMKKIEKRVSKKTPAAQRRQLLERIEKQLRNELRDAIDDFDFFFKKVAHLGRKRLRLPPPPRAATVLESNEIAFTAHVFWRLRRLLNTLIASDWQLIGAGCAQVVGIEGEPFASEHMTSHLLGVSRQTLYDWRRNGKISGYTWTVLSRSRKAISLHDRKAPPSSWLFYAERELLRLKAERPQRGASRASPAAASDQLSSDVSQEIAELFAEFQGSPTEPEAEDGLPESDDQPDPQG